MRARGDRLNLGRHCRLVVSRHSGAMVNLPHTGGQRFGMRSDAHKTPGLPFRTSVQKHLAEAMIILSALRSKSYHGDIATVGKLMEALGESVMIATACSILSLEQDGIECGDADIAWAKIVCEEFKLTIHNETVQNPDYDPNAAAN